MTQPYEHSFQKSKRKEQYATPIIDACFEGEYIVVPATEVHDRQQYIDRIFIRRRDAREIYLVDYKLDDVAHRSGNLPLEFASYDKDAWFQVGWLFKSEAHYVVFYLPAVDRGYLLEPAKLRFAFPTVIKIAGAPKLAWSRGTTIWCTRNYCAPITRLKDAGLISREFCIEGPQRLLWKASA